MKNLGSIKLETMKLAEPYFTQLGKSKLYEMRPLVDAKGNPKKQAKWNVRQEIMVTPNDGESGDSYVVLITERHVFPTFRKALDTFGYEHFMPSASDANDAEDKYKRIANGDYAKAEALGDVVAWRMVRQGT